MYKLGSTKRDDICSKYLEIKYTFTRRWRMHVCVLSRWSKDPNPDTDGERIR
jgi:hypothetical protein